MISNCSHSVTFHCSPIISPLQSSPVAAQGHPHLHSSPPNSHMIILNYLPFKAVEPLVANKLYYLFLHWELAQRVWNLSGLSVSLCLVPLILAPDVRKKNLSEFSPTFETT